MSPSTPPRGKTQGATASGERIAEGGGPAPSRGPAAPRRPAPPAPPAHRPPSRLHVQILDVRRRAPQPLPHLRHKPAHHPLLDFAVADEFDHAAARLVWSIALIPAIIPPMALKTRTRNPRVDRESLAQKNKNSCFSMLIASPSKPFESAERHSGCSCGCPPSAPLLQSCPPLSCLSFPFPLPLPSRRAFPLFDRIYRICRISEGRHLALLRDMAPSPPRKASIPRYKPEVSRRRKPSRRKPSAAPATASTATWTPSFSFLFFCANDSLSTRGFRILVFEAMGGMMAGMKAMDQTRRAAT